MRLTCDFVLPIPGAAGQGSGAAAPFLDGSRPDDQPGQADLYGAGGDVAPVYISRVNRYYKQK